MKKLLLHVCCGPCSTNVINELKKECEMTLLFYNPNIYPKAEYVRRLEAAKTVADKMKVKLMIGDYDNKNWENFVAEYANEPECGRRCELCFEYRLSKTADTAKRDGFDMFAATLTIGPNKNAIKINRVGKKLEKEFHVKFLEADFKKKDGFLKSIRMSKEMGVYRQSYCGCRFSLRSSIASPKL